MYGEISAEMLSETESPEWTIRKFRLGYVSTGWSTSGSGSNMGPKQKTTVFSVPTGRRDSGRPPSELHLVAGSRRPHSQRHREHPAVRPHRPAAGPQDQRPHHSPLQVRMARKSVPSSRLCPGDISNILLFSKDIFTVGEASQNQLWTSARPVTRSDLDHETLSLLSLLPPVGQMGHHSCWDQGHVNSALSE